MAKLTLYKKKRDFETTPEPKDSKGAGELGSKGEKEQQRIFVVQEHHATHLHWDFRLEEDGVLKSWAVPKGPPEEAGIKRLAMQVEDHPLDYAGFEGTIQAGQYGSGTVKIWDKGTYETVLKEPNKGRGRQGDKEKGSPGKSGSPLRSDKGAGGKRTVWRIRLNGKRMVGEYTLVHTGERNWLLFKNK